MTLEGLNKRLAALERRTEITRLCVAFATPPDCEFFGLRVSPIWNVDFDTEHLKPDEYFEVYGTDREACIERATAMADERWLEHTLLVVHMTPLIEPPNTTEVTPQ